jgi:lysyl-tRNA synthetase class 2
MDEMNDQTENRLIAERRDKLGKLRDLGNPFPNDFRRDAIAGEVHAAYGEHTDASLDREARVVNVAGRMMAKRVMGKVSFANLQDRSGQLQLFIERDRVSPEVYQAFKAWDLGDIVGATGTLFKTKTGELSVRVDDLRLLVKSLRPMPEKWHGITDQELRLRQRYVDLIVNEQARQVFALRTEIVRFIRSFLEALGFTEVETPMMHPIPGGALARPFVTHHNALLKLSRNVVASRLMSADRNPFTAGSMRNFPHPRQCQPSRRT